MLNAPKKKIIHHCLNAEDVCFLSLELYIDKKVYVDFMEHFK